MSRKVTLVEGNAILQNASNRSRMERSNTGNLQALKDGVMAELTKPPEYKEAIFGKEGGK